MIVFSQVSAEFRNIVERRRRQLTFLFSTAAALALVADASVRQQLPLPVPSAKAQLLPVWAGILAVIGLLTSLREAELHRGLVYNGVLYRAILARSKIVPAQLPASAARLNRVGVSFSLFLIAFVTELCALAYLLVASQVAIVPAGVVGAVFAVAPIAYLRSQRHTARRLAFQRLANDQCAVTSVDEWHSHLLASIEDSHRDTLELLALAGLLTFFGFQVLTLSGFMLISGGSQRPSVEQISPQFVILVGYLLLTLGLITSAYIRLRYAIGHFAWLVNPAEKPFRLLRIDDSFFGLAILAVILSTDVLMLLASLGVVVSTEEWLWGIAGLTGLVLVVEQLLLFILGRARQRPDAWEQPLQR